MNCFVSFLMLGLAIAAVVKAVQHSRYKVRIIESGGFFHVQVYSHDWNDWDTVLTSRLLETAEKHSKSLIEVNCDPHKVVKMYETREDREG